MLRLVVIGGLAVLVFISLRWLSRQPRSVQWQYIAGFLALILLLLVVTGRAHWLAAVFAASLPFLRAILSLLAHIPLLQRVLASVKTAQSSNRSSSGQTSTVRSRYILMTLNHDTGDINGEILEGRFKGMLLDQLKLEQLLELLQECRDDGESAALLQAYLDREYEDTWQQHAGDRSQHETSSASGKMSREEALQILGLSGNPDNQDIIQAHRRLMQTMHPDRGGSDYLAAKINLAKDTLLSQ